MNVSRLIFRLAPATLAACLFAATAHAYSDEAVKDAEALVKHITQRNEAGEVTRTDVAQAQYHLLEMKYRARVISRRTYCRSGLPVLETIQKRLEDEANVGQRTTQNRIDGKRELYKFKALCEESETKAHKGKARRGGVGSEVQH
jgi:hypothetical protein